jgi:hypothetical protein
MTILGDSVGANGCSPEELREEERAQDRRDEIPCKGPEQETPNRSILGQAFRAGYTG